MAGFPKGKRQFFLEELGEPEANMLRLVVVEATAQGPEVGIPDTSLKGWPITRTPDARPIELIWENVIAYAVRNESFAIQEDGQPPLEDMLSERSQSAFLAFVAKSTLATVEYPGPYKHWELVCLDHVIDVACVSAPTIRML